jgi:murein L,D-transpeptidase YafK
MPRNLPRFIAILLLVLIAGREMPARADYAVPVTERAADRILVVKSERRLYLFRGSEVLRAYRVSLGLNPRGHKERAGDFRTPEGMYRLSTRNRRSAYFLSIKISYPERDDVMRARANGWEVGGQIMIHGLPNNPSHPDDYYTTTDWTDGCIALSNADMLELWSLVDRRAIVEIKP